jgi:hypothetical protein
MGEAGTGVGSASGRKFQQVKPPLFFAWPRRGSPRLASLNKGFPNEGQAEKSKAWACQNLVPEAISYAAIKVKKNPYPSKAIADFFYFCNTFSWHAPKRSGRLPNNKLDFKVLNKKLR